MTVGELQPLNDCVEHSGMAQVCDYANNQHSISDYVTDEPKQDNQSDTRSRINERRTKLNPVSLSLNCKR